MIDVVKAAITDMYSCL